MIRIGTSEDLQEIKSDIPPEVKKEIQEVINMLDESYGEFKYFKIFMDNLKH